MKYCIYSKMHEIQNVLVVPGLSGDLLILLCYVFLSGTILNGCLMTTVLPGFNMSAADTNNVNSLRFSIKYHFSI